MSIEVYAWSFCEDERPETIESRTEERDSSEDRATSISMYKNPSGVGAPISQMHWLRSHRISVVWEKVTEEE